MPIRICLRCILTAMAAVLAACDAPTPSGPEEAKPAEFEIAFESYELDNGLKVVLHEDHSDPIVAVASVVHVGSSRETPGRTGFAHFFEHMSFNDSENVPRGANRKMIPELGGRRNGGTWSDGTIYYEVVPKDAFEKILWIDSDRLGFMINTVTEQALEREKQVVKNEKRQRVDNAPYGHTSGVIRANLYPEDHPYNWTVIGSLPDLQAATLSDVTAFYDKFYGPNNTTLVIAGDIDIEETKRLVEYWFGEIQAGDSLPKPAPKPTSLAETKSLTYEDNFAKLPELRMVFPTVELYNPEQYSLDVLAEALAGSKKAPLYQVIVEERKLAPAVSVRHDTNELAGTLEIRVRGNEGVSLDDVKAAVEEGLARFAEAGISGGELERIKAIQERVLYEGVSDVLSKAFQLAIYNEFAGDPGYISVEAKKIESVERADVARVFETFVAGRPYILTSFVPKGQSALAVTGAMAAQVEEEQIVADAEAEVSQGEEADYEKTRTANDRSEPALGDAPLLRSPEVWASKLGNGLEVLGIQHDEVPLVAFDLTIRGGHWLDPEGKAGTAYLLGDLMMQGTIGRTAAELEQAIGLLGADISIETDLEEIRVEASTLARNFEATVDLVREILLEPRWDMTEYERLVQELETRLRDREANPRAISEVVISRLLYGEKHVFGTSSIGTTDSVAALSIDDLKAYYEASLSPTVTTLHLVGAVDQERALAAFQGLAEDWEPREVVFPSHEAIPAKENGIVYFVDVPDAKQSVLRVAKLTIPASHEDYNKLGFANQRLGGGSSGRLFQLLRIEKGYTYGAYSGLGSTLETVPFGITTSVRANVTLDSLELIREQLQNYEATFVDEDLEVTKNQTIKGNTRRYESLGSQLFLLGRMSKPGLPTDVLERDQEELMGMTLEDFRQQIATYLQEQQMIYLVVGDAKTQLEQVAKLGFGPPVLLDSSGNLIDG